MADFEKEHEIQVDLSNLWIPETRQRLTYSQAALDSLAVSMQSKGQLQNLLIIEETNEEGKKWRLIAGYRRTLAAKKLGWSHLRAIVKTNLNPLYLEEIELDENLQRENLPWQEEVAAKKRVWDIRAELYGETVKEAAEHIGISHGSLFEDANLASYMEAIPELSKAKNKTQAQSKLKLIRRRMALEELASRGSIVAEGDVDYSGRVLLGDCVEIMKGMANETIDCIITDPPYGIDLEKGETKRSSNHPTIYEDSHYSIMEVVELAAREGFRLLKPHTHAYFWFDIKAYQSVIQLLRSVGFSVDPIPLIWAKNIPGQANHPGQRFASSYEACFFCRKGERQLLKQGQANVLNYDVVPPNKKIHPVEKPTGLLRQIIESSTVAGEVILDMFGGSGSTGEAAIQCGRNFLLIEKDPAFHAGIIERLSKTKSSLPNVVGDEGTTEGEAEEN